MPTPTPRERLLKNYLEELRHLELVEAVTSEDIPVLGIVGAHKVSPHTYMCDAAVTLTVETLPEALTIAERLNPLPLFRSTKGGLAFVPEGCEKEQQDEDAGCVGAYAYTIDGRRQHSETKTLFFFVKAPSGRVLRINVEVTNDPLNRRVYDVQRVPGGVVIKGCRISTGCGNWLSYDRFWSRHDQPNRYTLYTG